MKRMLSNLKSRLFRLGEDELLSPLSILVLILLDIFLLVILFQGLDAQSKIITQPNEYVPYLCRQIIIDKEWTPDNRLNRLSYIVIDYHRSTDDSDEGKKSIHPVCKTIMDAIDRVKNDPSIVKLFEERDRLIILQNELENAFKGSGLLKEDKTYRKYAESSIQISGKINTHPKVIKLWNIIDKAMAKQEIMIRALRNYRFFFPIYEVLFQFLFLLPLLALFYFWYRKSTGSRLQSLIATHLLVVVSIPIFLKLIQLILDIIPEQFIKKFIDMLDSLKLIALWYYIVIAFAIGVAIVLIYILQKHLFHRDKIIDKRIRSGNCVSCGKKLPEHDHYCSACGTDQYKSCKECSRLTYVNSKYCRECGKKIEGEQ